MVLLLLVLLALSFMSGCSNLEGDAVMAVAMFANLLVAELSGTLVPLGLLRSGFDPALG